MTETGYRIYIAEDDPVIAGALADYLGKWGYGVKIAGDFAHIDTECGEYAPHLVIMDIMLPFFNMTLIMTLFFSFSEMKELYICLDIFSACLNIINIEIF